MSFLSLILFLLLASSCLTLAQDRPAPTDAGGDAFAIGLYRQLASQAPADQNLFFSPFSIRQAVAMTYSGAAGVTETEMREAMHFEGDAAAIARQFAAINEALSAAGRRDDPRKGSSFELAVANALWPKLDLDLRDAFTQEVREVFRATLERLDYAKDPEACRLTINAAVAEQTKGKIKDLLSPGDLDRATDLVLTNAIYFKASWRDPFSESSTSQQPFQAPGKAIEVPLMRRTGHYQFLETGQVQVVSIPYLGEGVSMIVVLPATDRDFAAFEKSLTGEQIEGWFRKLTQKSTHLQLELPRFKIEESTPLTSTLKAMGLTTAFSSRACFSGMSATPLFISEAIHAAIIEVDEAGTEAAAATALMMTRSAAPRPPQKHFRADRPFLFFIRDDTTKSLLFMGRLCQPKS
ncbi:MAG: serpin family protein [Planctomycetes bacterium]|nr:serpin family protein [Planctomycetota bacterium]